LSDAAATIEKEIVSRERGRLLAEAWAKDPKKLAIPDTLLSSEAIMTVVEATGLISPFFTGGGRKARLKKASYEGRIGSKAYIYREENVPEQIFDSSRDEYLNVEKNSIVFVESDLDFRLPDFIALRFNLQIQHVHRGLLLGTGPLVDPGFWGKLCIPLHNLTDKDYIIPKEQGLIWVEFTKTTLPTNKTDDARAALHEGPRDEKGRWNIDEFLDKAATQYTGLKVPIRSSLPTMFGVATEAATKSAEEARAAKEDAKSALDVADKFRFYNVLSLIGAAVGFLAVCIAATSFLFNLSSRNEEIAGRLSDNTTAAQQSIERHINEVDRYGLQAVEARAFRPAIRSDLVRQDQAIAQLSSELKFQKLEIERLKQQDQYDRCMMRFGKGIFSPRHPCGAPR
jgi:deoxycytidine triphosphate deaminase